MPFNFDVSSPADDADISLHPANERSLRTTLKAWANFEHDADEGRHSFGSGDTATRDAISTWVVGSLWLATDVTTGEYVLQYCSALPALTNWEDIGIVHLDQNNTWSKAQWGDYVVLGAQSGNVDLDLSASSYFDMTTSGNIVLVDPTTLPGANIGTSFRVRIKSGDALHTISYGATWGFPFGVQPPLTGTLNAIDVLYCTVEPDGTITASMLNDVK